VPRVSPVRPSATTAARAAIETHHSLKPRICEVEAVGIGAISRLLRTPCLAILERRPAQSQRSVGVTFHMSNCRMPLLTGLPSYVSYGPSR